MGSSTSSTETPLERFAALLKSSGLGGKSRPVADPICAGRRVSIKEKKENQKKAEASQALAEGLKDNLRPVYVAPKGFEILKPERTENNPADPLTALAFKQQNDLVRRLSAYMVDNSKQAKTTKPGKQLVFVVHSVQVLEGYLQFSETFRETSDCTQAFQWARQLEQKGVWSCVHHCDGEVYSPSGRAYPLELALGIKLARNTGGNVCEKVEPSSTIQVVPLYHNGTFGQARTIAREPIYFFDTAEEQEAKQDRNMKAVYAVILDLNCASVWTAGDDAQGLVKQLLATRDQAIAAMAKPIPYDRPKAKGPVCKRPGGSHSTQKKTWPYMRVKG